MYYVYYTYKNDEPDKAYIGMTKQPIETGYKGSGIYILKSLKKHGKRNFTRADLGEFNDKKEAHFWEGFYIKTLKTLVSQGGYNLSPKGGLECPGCFSKESLIKKSKSMKGKNIGRLHSKEWNSRISISLRGKPGTMKGKHHTEATKRKISEIKQKRDLLKIK